jgi:hypothetical protein
MVVVVKASVAAEELERTLQAGRSTAGSNCTCKPGECMPWALYKF